MSAQKVAPSKQRSGLKQKFSARASARVSRWVKRRQGTESLPVHLRAKRLYILPTKTGLTFALVCFAMLLGSMNYNNSMGFALTFLLAATGLIAMHRCHQNLSGLSVDSVFALKGFAGQALPVEIQLTHPGKGERYEIRANMDASVSETIDIASGVKARLRIDLAPRSRGWHALPRLGLSTNFPLMLLRCWVWLYGEQRFLVWPEPAVDAPKRPLTDSDRTGASGGKGEDDFAGLRDYQRGDSSRRVAWKTYARSGELKSRQFEGGSLSTSWIELASASGEDIEQRLSILCRWVLDAASDGGEYGLRVPGTTIPPGSGTAHRNLCLDTLAQYGLTDPAE